MYGDLSHFRSPDWEKKVSSAVQALEQAALKMEQRHSSTIRELGWKILRTISTQAQEREKMQLERLSAALMTVESFLARQKEDLQQHPDLISHATQTLLRFRQAWEQKKQSDVPEKSWRKRFAALLNSSNSKKLAVDRRMAHLRPQGNNSLQKSSTKPFSIRPLAPCVKKEEEDELFTKERDALRTKCLRMYREKYGTTALDTLSILQNARIFSKFTEKKSEPDVKIAHLHTILVNPARGERAVVEGAFERSQQGGARSVPLPDSFRITSEMHQEFPLCVQDCGFTWPSPDRILPANHSFWLDLQEKKRQQFGRYSREELLERNEELICAKNRLFRQHTKDLLGLVEEVVSAIVFKAVSNDPTWRPAVREYFASLVNKSDPFIFLSTVHQRLQTLLITRPLQGLENETPRIFSISQPEQIRNQQLLAKLTAQRAEELKGLTKNLDIPTHTYVSTLSSLLTPHTQPLLLRSFCKEPQAESSITDWQRRLQLHCLIQTEHFTEQFSSDSWRSDALLKDLLAHQIREKISLWSLDSWQNHALAEKLIPNSLQHSI